MSKSWSFAQVFGESTEAENIKEADTVTSVSFNSTGQYLAAGDRGGRVVIFHRGNSKYRNLPTYQFYVEFQSHEPEFDYLKSLEIEEKINKMKWLRRENNGQFIITTNDKTMKIWKIHEKQIKSIASGTPRKGQLVMPKVNVQESMVTATPRKIFSNAHAYHINSISISSDEETFISSDDLRINLWNLEINKHCFNIVDIKPENMEELSEVITTAEFHPLSCNLFMYSSSKGCIKLGDLRSSALCDRHSKVFEEEEDPSARSFFSELISSVSDIRFSPDGRYILTRDYMTLKIWDINMEAKPVKSYSVHPYLNSKLCDLYENDSIFDKFECTFNHTGSHAITGSYHNYFQIFDASGEDHSIMRASNSSPDVERQYVNPSSIDPDSLCYQKKVMSISSHPSENTIAIAAANNLFIYSAEGSI